MAGNRSFKDYVADRFYNEIFAAIQSYTTDNYDDLDLRLYRVRNIGGIELSDIEVKFVSVNDLPDMKIEFDVVVEAELEVRESDYHYDESENCRQWFMLTCSGDLACNLDDFTISSVTEYTSKNKQPKPMSDSLVPIIHKEQLESVATDFLCRHYPEALKTPMAIEPQVLAEKMGLTVEMREITKDFSVFGQLYFHDCDAEFYDKDSDKMVQTHVDARTIFVDPKAFFLRNLGSVNNTIVHECVHWYKHRKYHELVKTYNSDALLISCRVNETTKYKKQWTPEDWMEWHANGIAPRILMPKSMTIKKIEELIKKNELLFGTHDRLNIMENVVYELADFFQVSRIAAKIRMLDLGYKEVEGVYTYVDDHFISSYSFKADSLHKNQTYSISLSDSFFEYYANPEFAKIIDSGNFIYVDGHYVINDSKYIKRLENGSLDLTDYAKLHVDECCLLFDLELNKASKMDIVVYLDSIMFRKATPDYNRVPTFNPDKHNMEVFNRSEELKKFHEEFVEEGQHLSRTTQTFSQAVYGHIKRKGYNKVVFIEKTLLSGKTYDRIKNNELNNPTLETVVAICIGLELSPTYSEEILRLAGYTLNNTPQQLAYKKLIHSYRGHSIYECNEVLEALGLSPLCAKAYKEMIS